MDNVFLSGDLQGYHWDMTGIWKIHRNLSRSSHRHPNTLHRRCAEKVAHPAPQPALARSWLPHPTQRELHILATQGCRIDRKSAEPPVLRSLLPASLLGQTLGPNHKILHMYYTDYIHLNILNILLQYTALYIYIYINICKCVCVCSPILRASVDHISWIHSLVGWSPQPSWRHRRQLHQPAIF